MWTITATIDNDLVTVDADGTNLTAPPDVRALVDDMAATRRQVPAMFPGLTVEASADPTDPATGWTVLAALRDLGASDARVSSGEVPLPEGLDPEYVESLSDPEAIH